VNQGRLKNFKYEREEAKYLGSIKIPFAEKLHFK